MSPTSKKILVPLIREAGLLRVGPNCTGGREGKFPGFPRADTDLNGEEFPKLWKYVN